MENLQTYIQPELLILIPVLCFLGMGLKTSKIKDKYIPWILGGFGIGLAVLYVVGVSGINALSVFTAITQGILCAGGSVYANQLIKQTGKRE